MPRDANGVYSLPSGYEAVTGATIQASQHNPPLEDLGSAMTGSLPRAGTAAMTGPLKSVDGTEGAPGLTFSTATGAGFYKTTAGIGVSIGGVKVAEFTVGGLSFGGRYIGELIPWTRKAVAPLTVFPYGQTLDRVTYSALWAVAQVEIAAGNLFYNNGNGSTTFGIGDMRGRVFAGLNNMGGVSSGRLGSGAGFSSTGGADPNVIGSAAGVEIHTLTRDQIPTGIVSSGTLAVSGNVDSNLSFVTANGQSETFSSGTGGLTLWKAFNTGVGMLTQTASATGSVTSTNTGGTPHNNVQPTLVGPWLLFTGQ